MITLEKATLTHLDALSSLFDQYRVFYEMESALDEGKKFLRERIEMRESEIFVALNEDNVMTGFVQLYPLFSSTRMKRLWLLNDLFVHPNYRGEGISKALIEKAKDLCRSTNGCGIMLETAKTNMIGNALYPHTGFSLDTEHNYYEWNASE
ncbi:GNAT family N-acetyltransferase [Algivirga pacifica]|uniref:GNAT family N-acetyltransferase n=1 Tax=Algivirga pacifica TaxID=1162670 RepID=A0ABP9DCC6_9BACT